MALLMRCVSTPALARSFELTPATAFAVSEWSDPCRLRIAIERNYLIKQQALMATRVSESAPLIRFIGKELEKLRLPNWLIWLPLLESSYRSQVISSAGAAGLWQLMPDTAKRFGLVVSSVQDDRLQPAEATRAALQYLKWLQDYFKNDWALILAAYNSGEKRVRDAQSLAQATAYCDLKLPPETQRYVPRFLALVELMNHPVGNVKPPIRPPDTAKLVIPQKPMTIDVTTHSSLMLTDKEMDPWFIPKAVPVDMKGIGHLFEKQSALIPLGAGQ